MSESKIALSDLIVELRRELLEAQQKGAAADLKFKVEEIEVEAQVSATREGEGKAGIKFWLCELGASEKRAKGAVQTVRLKLKPNSSGLELNISDETSKPTD